MVLRFSNWQAVRKYPPDAVYLVVLSADKKEKNGQFDRSLEGSKKRDNLSARYDVKGQRVP
jgi:hypothetical protein